MEREDVAELRATLALAGDAKRKVFAAQDASDNIANGATRAAVREQLRQARSALEAADRELRYALEG